MTPDLEVRWHVNLDPSGVGHIPTIDDINDDGRDELVLCHPFVGEAVLILSQPDIECADKPYIHGEPLTTSVAISES